MTRPIVMGCIDYTMTFITLRRGAQHHSTTRTTINTPIPPPIPPPVAAAWEDPCELDELVDPAMWEVLTEVTSGSPVLWRIKIKQSTKPRRRQTIVVFFQRGNGVPLVILLVVWISMTNIGYFMVSYKNIKECPLRNGCIRGNGLFVPIWALW